MHLHTHTYMYILCDLTWKLMLITEVKMISKQAAGDYLGNCSQHCWRRLWIYFYFIHCDFIERTDMTVHVSDTRDHNEYVAPLRLPCQGREEDRKWKISVDWAQSAFLLLRPRTARASIVPREIRKRKLVKETENQYWLMAKILMLREWSRNMVMSWRPVCATE